MSGGHYDGHRGTSPEYLVREMGEQILVEVCRRPNEQRAARAAFAVLLAQVADAIHELDWIDSGDTSWPECPTLMALATPQRQLDAAMSEAVDAAEVLYAAIAAARAVTP